MEVRELLAVAVVPKETYGTLSAWLSFVVFIAVLMVFDVKCLEPHLANSGRMSFKAAVKLTGFWFLMGIVFDLFLLGSMGFEASVGFLQGLLLEYMLSFDNLFVFHMVFAYYCTPEHLVYRALYYGIAGAILLRMLFLLLGGCLFGMDLPLVKFIFGAVLIWSGIKSANDMDDEEENPTNNPFIAWVTKHFPVSDNYEPNGHFFVTVAEVECRPAGQSSTITEDDIGLVDEDSLGPPTVSDDVGPTFPRLESFEGASLLDPQNRSCSRQPPMASSIDEDGGDSFEVTRPRGRLRRKASLLLLVVVAVWIVDLVFAVDSVASKLAVVTDLFLNCSSSAFAMLSLRSLYFVMESLVETFAMLKYGIAAILILLGLKLVFASYITISSAVSFFLIMVIMVGAIVCSYIKPRLRVDDRSRMDDGELDGGDLEEDSAFATHARPADGANERYSSAYTDTGAGQPSPKSKAQDSRLAAMETATAATLPRDSDSPRGENISPSAPIMAEAAE